MKHCQFMRHTLSRKAFSKESAGNLSYVKLKIRGCISRLRQKGILRASHLVERDGPDSNLTEADMGYPGYFGHHREHDLHHTLNLSN